MIHLIFLITLFLSLINMGMALSIKDWHSLCGWGVASIGYATLVFSLKLK